MELRHVSDTVKSLITKCHDSSMNEMDWDMLIEEIIDECLFAMLIATPGKFDMHAAKKIMMEHFGLTSAND
jgi:hypothetical protein